MKEAISDRPPSLSSPLAFLALPSRPVMQTWENALNFQPNSLLRTEPDLNNEPYNREACARYLGVYIIFSSLGNKEMRQKTRLLLAALMSDDINAEHIHDFHIVINGLGFVGRAT